jgi:hypothetical protein
VVELARLEAGIAQAPGCGERREARNVLDAVEALFLGSSDQLSVDHEGRSRVTVEGVEPQDRGHRRLILATASSSTAFVRAAQRVRRLRYGA